MMIRTIPDDAPDMYSFATDSEQQETITGIEISDGYDGISEPRKRHSVSNSHPESEKIGSRANQFLSYPKFYFHRGGVSDKRFVMQRMAVIPADPPIIRHEISREYEARFVDGTGNRRKEANEWLNQVALNYRDGKI